MLVLTQASVGGFAIDLAAWIAGGPGSTFLVLLSLGFGLLGLVASTCHLGRPHYAYRALIGLRHSWLSREVATFGLFAKLAILHAGLTLLMPTWYAGHPTLRLALAASVVVAGMAGVFSSVMVYHVVRRPFWHASIGGVKFAGTALVLGLSAALLVSVGASSPRVEQGLALGLMIAVAAKLAFEASLLRHLKDPQITSLRRSAHLVRWVLKAPALQRVMVGLAGGFAVPLFLLCAGTRVDPTVKAAFAMLGMLALLGGEIAERYLFFAAVVKPKMPGGILT
jgi:DMSO reductase anchor subunit